MADTSFSHPSTLAILATQRTCVSREARGWEVRSASPTETVLATRGEGRELCTWGQGQRTTLIDWAPHSPSKVDRRARRAMVTGPWFSFSSISLSTRHATAQTPGHSTKTALRCA